MTQRERVLLMLKAGPVCGTDFLSAYIPRYSARILELRQQGFLIVNRPCRMEHHGHRSGQTVFELEELDQQRLFA